MKKSLFYVLILFTSFGCKAQFDSIPSPFSIGVKMSLGHLKGDYINGDKNISSRVYVPQLEIGRKLKFNIGALVLRTDSLVAVDSFDQRLARLAMGFSFKEYIGKSNLYAQGGYSLLLIDNVGPEREGHFINLEIGQTISRVNIDLFLSAGRLFDKEQIFTGSTFKFGVRLFEEW